MSVSISDLEKTASQILANVMDHEGTINLIAGAVGILPEVALAEKALPLLAGLLQFLQDANGSSLTGAFGDLLNHLTPGKPNAPALAQTPGQDQSSSGGA